MTSQPPQNQTFNWLDFLKELTPLEVKMHCADNSFPAAVAMVNLNGDFNFSSIVRNANAFGLRDVFFISPRKKWDKRGAVGTYHYTNVAWCPTLDDFWEASAQYIPVALENNINYDMVSVNDFAWPTNPVIILGEEGNGLDDALLERVNSIITIPQYGSVRSVNAAVAAGIAMNSYSDYQIKNHSQGE